MEATNLNKKERMIEIARKKIMMQQQRPKDASSKKSRKRTQSSCSGDNAEQEQCDPARMDRRQSFPPTTKAPSSRTTQMDSGFTADSVTVSATFAVIKKEKKVDVREYRLKCSEESTPKKAKLISDSMPIPLNKIGRKSSFLLRKQVDNELGYKPRGRRHRHAHQRAREREYMRFCGLLPEDASDTE